MSYFETNNWVMELRLDMNRAPGNVRYVRHTYSYLRVRLESKYGERARGTS